MDNDASKSNPPEKPNVVDEKEEGEISLDDVSSSEEVSSNYNYVPRNRDPCTFCFSTRQCDSWCTIKRRPTYPAYARKDTVHEKRNGQGHRDSVHSGTKKAASILQERNKGRLSTSSDSEDNLGDSLGRESKKSLKRKKSKKKEKERLYIHKIDTPASPELSETDDFVTSKSRKIQHIPRVDTPASPDYNEAESHVVLRMDQVRDRPRIQEVKKFKPCSCCSGICHLNSVASPPMRRPKSPPAKAQVKTKSSRSSIVYSRQLYKKGQIDKNSYQADRARESSRSTTNNIELLKKVKRLENSAVDKSWSKKSQEQLSLKEKLTRGFLSKTPAVDKESHRKKIQAPKNKDTAKSESKKIADDDESLEDLLLRQNALRSAFLRKHNERKQKGLLKVKKPRPDSPLGASFIANLSILENKETEESKVNLDDMELDTDIEQEKEEGDSPYSPSDEINKSVDLEGSMMDTTDNLSIPSFDEDSNANPVDYDTKVTQSRGKIPAGVASGDLAYPESEDYLPFSPHIAIDARGVENCVPSSAIPSGPMKVVTCEKGNQESPVPVPFSLMNDETDLDGSPLVQIDEQSQNMMIDITNETTWLKENEVLGEAPMELESPEDTTVVGKPAFRTAKMQLVKADSNSAQSSIPFKPIKLTSIPKKHVSPTNPSLLFHDSLDEVSDEIQGMKIGNVPTSEPVKTKEKQVSKGSSDPSKHVLEKRKAELAQQKADAKKPKMKEAQVTQSGGEKVGEAKNKENVKNATKDQDIEDDEEALRAMLLASLQKKKLMNPVEPKKSTPPKKPAVASSVKVVSPTKKAPTKKVALSPIKSKVNQVQNNRTSLASANNRGNNLNSSGGMVRRTVKSYPHVTKAVNNAKRSRHLSAQKRMNVQKMSVTFATQQPRILRKVNVQERLRLLPKPVPEKERFIINLRESDTDTETDDATSSNAPASFSSANKEYPMISNVPTKEFEKSVDLFLKSARQKQEFSTPTKATMDKSEKAETSGAGTTWSTPLAVRHLPASKQEEYRRLKQQIALREGLMLHKTTANDKPKTTSRTSEKSPPVTSKKLAPAASSTVPPAKMSTAAKKVSPVKSTNVIKITKTSVVANKTDSIEPIVQKLTETARIQVPENVTKVPDKIVNKSQVLMEPAKNSVSSQNTENVAPLPRKQPTLKILTSQEVNQKFENGLMMKNVNRDSIVKVDCVGKNLDKIPISNEGLNVLVEKSVIVEEEMEEVREKEMTTPTVSNSDKKNLTNSDNQKSDTKNSLRCDSNTSDKKNSPKSEKNSERESILRELNAMDRMPVEKKDGHLEASWENLVDICHVAQNDLSGLSTDLQALVKSRSAQLKLQEKVKKFREQLAEAEEELKIEKKKRSDLAAKVSASNEKISETLKKCNYQSKLCKMLGIKLHGPGYKLPDVEVERQLNKKMLEINAFKEKLKKSATIATVKTVSSEKERKMNANDQNANSDAPKITTLEKSVAEVVVVDDNPKRMETEEVAKNDGQEVARQEENPQGKDVDSMEVELTEQGQDTSAENPKTSVEKIDAVREPTDVILPKKTVKPYESILLHLRTPENEDCFKILCPFQLRGTCNDGDCEFLHHPVPNHRV